MFKEVVERIADRFMGDRNKKWIEGRMKLLDEARRERDKMWARFGGRDGTEVNLEEIMEILRNEHKVKFLGVDLDLSRILNGKRLFKTDSAMPIYEKLAGDEVSHAWEASNVWTQNGRLEAAFFFSTRRRQFQKEYDKTHLKGEERRITACNKAIELLMKQ